MRSYGERPLFVAAAGLTGNSREEVAQRKRVAKQKVLMSARQERDEPSFDKLS